MVAIQLFVSGLGLWTLLWNLSARQELCLALFLCGISRVPLDKAAV